MRAGMRLELSAGDVPDHIRFQRTERYRDVIAASLVEKPGDVFAAGYASFRAWCAERHAYERAHDLLGPDKRDVRKALLGPLTRPDFLWICREFGVEWEGRRDE